MSYRRPQVFSLPTPHVAMLAFFSLPPTRNLFCAIIFSLGLLFTFVYITSYRVFMPPFVASNLKLFLPLPFSLFCLFVFVFCSFLITSPTCGTYTPRDWWSCRGPQRLAHPGFPFYRRKTKSKEVK